MRVALVLAALLVASCGAGQQTSPLPANAQRILDEHNTRRKKHCAAPLAWSSEVAAVAQRWAERCKFEHSKGSGYGENLAIGTGNLAPERVVSMWYDEVSKYDFAKPGFAAATGHFTQVVWKGTTHIGCGSAICAGSTLWVCHYDPPGNVIGRFPEHVLPDSCAR